MDYPYVIITNNALKDAVVSPNLYDLLNQRQMQGFNGWLIIRDYINDVYAGVDIQEKIRNFISDAFNQWGTRYVCLCGDDPIIPARVMAEGYQGDTTGVASDIYYACLDGTYDNNSNGKYGQVDDGINGGIPVWRPADSSARQLRQLHNYCKRGQRRKH